ncbi:MAG: tetratricopeptide repeat protein [Terriglobales bacterium]
MRRAAVIVALLCLSLSSFAQLDKIVIPAGTPEDVALAAISNEQDAQKKVAMYEEFVQKFSGNPAAVAYGNWQIAQSYQTDGNLEKALSYGDKALAGAPNNLDILVSQTNVAQQMKSNAKAMDYAIRGGKAYNSAAQTPKPEGMTDEQFATRVAEAKESNKSSYEFLETAAFNSIADEKDAKTRMNYIERFAPAFPASRFEEPVTQYAMYTLGQLNDSARLYSYGEKALAANPNSMPTMLLLASTYVEDTRPGSLAKAITYSQKVIVLAKADAPDADKSRKLSGGVAHSTLGYAYAKQEKVAAAIPELKTAAALLKGQDDVSYATALYRLGWAYGKTNRIAEARAVLEEAIKIPGPLQGPCRELLATVNAARKPK